MKRLLSTPSKKGDFERYLLQRMALIAGLDEVGRGCLAGPVVAACISLDYGKLFALADKDINLIRDSKTLSHAQRLLALKLVDICKTKYGIGVSSVDEIEKFGIQTATFNAMKRAIVSADCQNFHLLVDGNQSIPSLDNPQSTIVKGDSLAYCIAAASIVAKEFRDELMSEQDLNYPLYSFKSNMGYGTAAHLTALKEHGFCPLHRKNFAPISSMLK